MKKSCRFVFFGFLFLLSNYLLIAQILPGGSVAGNDWKIWNLVRDEEPTARLKGVLLEWYNNKGLPPLYDWDLCIHIKPSFGYSNFATNALGNTNENPGNGLIELEIQSLGNSLGDNPVNMFEDFFSELFQVDREVEAYGLWVQDWGHDPWNPKTELHPLFTLTQTNGSIYLMETSIFAGRDISGRFNYDPIGTAGWDMRRTRSFTFPLPGPEVFKVSRASSTLKSWGATRIIEKSVMDISTNERSMFTRGINDLSPSPYFWISVWFGEPSSVDRGENGGGLRNLNQGHYHPFFLGKVSIERRCLDVSDFICTVKMTSKTCIQAGLDPSQFPPNEKVIEIAIDAGWETEFANASWFTLSKFSPAGESDYSETKYQVGEEANRVQFLRYYSPKLGLNNTEWMLTVKSSDDQQIFTRDPPKTGGGPRTETILFKALKIVIPHSTMNIVIPCPASPRGGINMGGVKWIVHCAQCPTGDCYAGIDLANGALIIPDSLEWWVKPVVDSEGNEILLPIPAQAIRLSNTPWEWQGIRISVDPSNPLKLNCSVANGVKTQVKVIAYAKTDIGENLEASKLIPGNFENCFIFGKEDFLESIVRGELVFRWLQEHGINVGIIPVEPRDIELFISKTGLPPVPWPKDQRIAVMPEPYKILPKLTGQPRQALEAFYKMTAGFRLTKREITLIARLATFGSRIKWSQQPPKDAFNFLKKNFGESRIHR
jgi:hypothetical protein